MPCAWGWYLNPAKNQKNAFVESEVLTNIDPTELDDFKGLPIRHRFSTPLEFLEEKQDYASIKAL